MKSMFDDSTTAEDHPQLKPRLLLVDDDPGIRQILWRLLSEEGYTVVTAASGVEALLLCGTTHFDLVLLDLNMPAKNGWDTLQQLTAKYPMLPIILITARPNQFFLTPSSGVRALMEKPLDFNRLFQTIHDLLEETGQRLSRNKRRPGTFGYVAPMPALPAKHDFLKTH